LIDSHALRQLQLDASHHSSSVTAGREGKIRRVDPI
jgi:hypothetical protein